MSLPSLAPTRPTAFGPPERRLFGILHRPAQAVSQGPGVVLCNAFGQEAIRAHRMQRVLAERLARAGHPVLRFDYYGSGDSMGTDLDADLEGWCSDVRAADAELANSFGCSSTVWFGMRLGATIALRAAGLGTRLKRLVMWDPVVDGNAYLGMLEECHAETVRRALDARALGVQAALADVLREKGGIELIGFGVSAVFRKQLEALNADNIAAPDAGVDVCLVTQPDSADGRAMAEALARLGRPAICAEVAHGTDWTTENADNAALVPMPALLQLVNFAGAPR